MLVHLFFLLMYRLYMKEKYSSKDWFREMLHSEVISVKDALKLYIANPLEMMLVS